MAGIMKSGTRGRQLDPTLIQVLSLYLLLLAFFVILYNISKVEQFKTVAVAESLNATFADQGRTSKNPTRLTSALGRIITDHAFQKRIGRLIANEIPLAQVTEIKPGSVFEARVPVEALFEHDDVAPSRLAWTRRLAGVLAGSPPGMRYEVDLMIGTAADDGDGDGDDGDGATRRKLALARAGHLAARLVAAGVPAGQVGAGLERGDPNWVRLVFYVRGATRAGAAEPDRYGGAAG